MLPRLLNKPLPPRAVEASLRRCFGDVVPHWLTDEPDGSQPGLAAAVEQVLDLERRRDPSRRTG